MKRLLFNSISYSISIILLVSGSVRAQDSFVKTYARNDDDVGESVQQTTDGGYVVTGWTRSYAAGIFDIFLVRTDSSGDTLWTKTYGGTESDWGNSVQQTADGGYIIVGGTRSFGMGQGDIYLLKTDASGVLSWTNTYGGSESSEDGSSVRQTMDGDYIITGWTQSFGAGSLDVYLIKTDSSGDTLWTRTFGGGDSDSGESVQQTSDGGYIIAGTTHTFGAGNADFYLIKTDEMGNVNWTRTYGGSESDIGRFAQQTLDGGYIFVGYTWSYGAGSTDIYLVKTGASGDTIWTRTYGGVNSDEGYCVRQSSDGGFIITGYESSSGSRDIYLLKTDDSGEIQWTLAIDLSEYGTEEGYFVEQTDDGGYVITGYAGFGPEDNSDVILIKSDATGNVGISTGGSQEPGNPRVFSLSQNYPNPFNPSTTIGFDIPGAAGIKQSVILAVYDIRGKCVRILCDSDLAPGSHKVHWDGRNDRGEPISSGIYLYQLKTGSETFTRKMTVLK